MNGCRDLIIVGGGPAGSAAAITAAERGLSVLLLERLAAPRDRPGEALHPGAEVLFEQLGVADAVRSGDFHRHEGCHLVTRGGRSYRAFGADGGGPWHGYQVRRAQLDRILVKEAQRRGADVIVGTAVQSLRQDCRGRVTGVIVDGTDHESQWVIDASGSGGRLRRQIGIAIERCSPELFAWYGYVVGRPSGCDGNPRLAVEPDGWTWIAPIEQDVCAWVRLRIGTGPKHRCAPPAPLANCRQKGPVRGMDVSWRILERVAAPGYFAVGDAASVLDPASSHGILKGLMNGIMAAHCIAQIEAEAVPETQAIVHYQSWLHGTFTSDAVALLSLYGELGIPIDGWSNGKVRPAAVA